MRQLTGTGQLTLLALRRDRLQLPVWILSLAALMSVFPIIYDNLFETDAYLYAAVRFYAENPITRMFGMSSGASLAEYTMTRAYTFMAVLASLMSLLTVVRHTRQNEEWRQTEVLRSTVTGRYADLAAALITAALANFALAVLIGIGLTANGLPVAGSFAAGAAIGAVGLTIGALAAVTAQVSSSSRGASGMAAAGSGVAFLLSAVGSVLGRVDESGVRVENAWPTWLSPIGWGQLMRPFGGDNWWLLGVFAASFVALAGLAFYLTDRRDVGRGLLAEGRGPARASSRLLHPFGLAWRLQRGVFFGWMAGVAAFGLVMGGIAGDIEATLGELEVMELFLAIGGTDQIMDAYFVAVMGLFGAIISAYTVQTLLRMRVEESDGPLESILGSAVSRTEWMASYVANAVLGTLMLMATMGASTGLAAGLALNDLRSRLPDLVLTGLVQSPGAFVVGGIAMAAFALWPRRAAGVAWVAFAVALLLGPMLGEMLALPGALMNLSPFTHIPNLPAGSLDPAPVAILMAIAIGLALGALIAFRRRDLVL